METLVEKILVIQTAFIGDAILTFPMLQELKRMNPDSLIDVISIPSTADLFQSSPAINEVIVLDKRGEHKSIFGLLKFSGMIRDKKYSRIYSPHRSFRTAFIVLQSRVRETYGFSNSSLAHAYRNPVQYNPDDHEVKRNLSLIGADTSGEKWRIAPDIPASPDIKKTAEEFLNHIGFSNFIAVAPGSIWKTKIYPVEYYREIINHLSLKGENIILIGGENDIELCGSLAGESGKNLISAAGKFNLIESAALLKHSKLLICNDSAPAHLGQAADIPVLTLYCSTTPSFGFFPYNKKSAYLSFDELWCKPCGIHGRNECPINTFKCGYNLLPGSVILKIEDLLNGKSERS